MAEYLGGRELGAAEVIAPPEVFANRLGHAHVEEHIVAAVEQVAGGEGAEFFEGDEMRGARRRGRGLGLISSVDKEAYAAGDQQGEETSADPQNRIIVGPHGDRLARGGQFRSVAAGQYRQYLGADRLGRHLFNGAIGLQNRDVKRRQGSLAGAKNLEDQVEGRGDIGFALQALMLPAGDLPSRVRKRLGEMSGGVERVSYL